MIYDAFTFFNELDLLDIRLHTLAPVVDLFVLVEATVTFQGDPKPLYYQEARDRFRGFSIIHVVVEDMPAGPDHWAREAFQRQAIYRGLGLASPEDVLLISDVDEIPHPDIIQILSDAPPPNGAVLMMHGRVYYFDLGEPGTVAEWPGTRVVPWALFEAHGRDAHQVRMHPSVDPVRFGDAGWHFSYFGGVERIRAKLRAFSHAEFNHPAILRGVPDALAAHTDPLQRDGARYHIPLDVKDPEDLPAYVLANAERFSYGFVPRA